MPCLHLHLERHGPPALVCLRAGLRRATCARVRGGGVVFVRFLICIRKDIYACMHIYIHYIHTYIHTYILTYVRTYVYIDKHTHKRACMSQSCPMHQYRMPFTAKLGILETAPTEGGRDSFMFYDQYAWVMSFVCMNPVICVTRHMSDSRYKRVNCRVCINLVTSCHAYA